MHIQADLTHSTPDHDGSIDQGYSIPDRSNSIIVASYPMS